MACTPPYLQSLAAKLTWTSLDSGKAWNREIDGYEVIAPAFTNSFGT